MTPTRRRRRTPLLLAALGTLLAHAAVAAGGGAGHVDLAPVLEGLVVVLLAARLGGALFELLHLPAVLGELVAGVALGNLGLFGVHGLEPLFRSETLSVLGEVGVLFLLFQVGLESDLGKMAAVGVPAMVVAMLGVVAPMALGYGVSSWFHPGENALMHAFVGATLAATSVGITARVLGDLGRVDSLEGRIILGAAVIDDVLGLIVLAVMQGLVTASNLGTALDAPALAWVIAKAVGFLVAAIVVGRWLSRTTFRLASRLPGQGLLLALSLAFCFGLSLLAMRAGLAAIVGAFAAGLVLDDVHFEDLRARDAHRRGLHELLDPLASFLVPVFFVLMGTGVDLSVFADPAVLGFAGVLTLAAILGKQICSLGANVPGVDRLAVGLGMIPRGEVGLIFASIGSRLMLGGEPLVNAEVYSAVVFMVAVTTLVTPPLLVWRLRRPAA
jgi:Kef-type K+ transport system membrane component KefB